MKDAELDSILFFSNNASAQAEVAGVVGKWKIQRYKMRGQKTDVFNSGVCVVNRKTCILVVTSTRNLGHGIPPAKKIL